MVPPTCMPLEQLFQKVCGGVGALLRVSSQETQGCKLVSIPMGLPEVDIRPDFVVLPAGSAHTVLLCVFHQGFLILHVLCYTLADEGYGPLLLSCCPQLQL